MGLKRFLHRRCEGLLDQFGIPCLSPSNFAGSSRPRVAFYAASIVGLGHVARVCRIASEIRRQRPDVDLLLLTDTAPDVIDRLAPGLPFVHLPNYALRQTAQSQFSESAAGMGLSKQQLRDLRANVILSTIYSFQPSVFLCDTLPHGKRDELLPTLRHLGSARPRCRRILLLRDIPCTPDEPLKVNAHLSPVARHHGFYDRILIAGDRSFYNVEEKLGWPAAMVAKSRYIGYVVPAPEAPTAERNGMRQIVASFGGGWEGADLAAPVVEAFQRLRRDAVLDFRLYLSTGPAVNRPALAEMERAATGLNGEFTRRTFDAEFPERLARADLAILQGGSTVFQILDSDIPILLYARDFKIQEQAERCERVAAFDGVELIQREDFQAPEVLAQRMASALERPRVKRQTGLGFQGLGNAAEEVVTAL